MTRHWKVSEVARRAHVTVRTLHHYDEIGLLVPSERSSAGYRLYSRGDLERLHRILLYRELGFALDGIAHLLDEPSIDQGSALRAQRELLLEKRRQTDAVIQAVDRALEAMRRREPMDTDTMFDGFEAFENAPEDVKQHQAKYGAEAEERWGDSDAYKESMRRAKSYTKEDWKKIQAEGERLEKKMVALMVEGADPEGPDAVAGAEEMRQHITRSFYPCSPRMHANLADMYESDARFTAHYEDRAEGLATFVARAIRANAAAQAD